VGEKFGCDLEANSNMVQTLVGKRALKAPLRDLSH